MIKRLLMAVTLSGAVAFGLSAPANSADKDTKADTTAVKPDNTKMNKEAGGQKHDMTADQQSEHKTDRKITQEIRRTITKDKSLSTYAKNVKIITKGGMVTLKGPVRSQDEVGKIEQAAASVVGKDKVTNELTVAKKETKQEKKEKKEQKKEMKEKDTEKK